MGPGLLRLTQAIGNLAWKTIGNAGPNLDLGTTTNNEFTFITNNTERGGFTSVGAFFLSPRNNLSASRSVATTNATPTTIQSGGLILGLPYNLLVEFRTSAFRTNGIGYATFKRSVMVSSDGATSTVWNPMTTLFTDKQGTAVNYDVQVISLAPTFFSVQVIGDVGHDVNWVNYMTTVFRI